MATKKTRYITVKIDPSKATVIHLAEPVVLYETKEPGEYLARIKIVKIEKEK